MRGNPDKHVTLVYLTTHEGSEYVWLDGANLRVWAKLPEAQTMHQRMRKMEKLLRPTRGSHAENIIIAIDAKIVRVKYPGSPFKKPEDP